MTPQQLSLLSVETSSPVPVLKGIIWTKTFQGWKGEFAVIGSKQRKKYTEYDYECQIYNPEGRFETYIQVSSTINTTIEHDFCATVTRLVDARVTNVLVPSSSPDSGVLGDFVLKEVFDTSQAENPDCYVLEQVNNVTVPELSTALKGFAFKEEQANNVTVPELSTPDEVSFSYKEVLDNTSQVANPDSYVLEQVNNATVPELSTPDEVSFSYKEVLDNTSQAANPDSYVLEQVNNVTVPELSTPDEVSFSYKEVLDNTSQAANPDSYVLEQVNNATVPELSTWKCLQWIETYSPSKRKSKYFRYCWKDSRMHHMHIAGGSVTNEVAVTRKVQIENAIASGLSPAEIKGLIGGWKIEKP